jgi:hypothetical protein
MAHMSAVLSLQTSGPAADANESRVAKRSRVFMRAAARIPESNCQFHLSIKDISSTGLRALPELQLFQDTTIEVDLRNIGWVAGQVVWVDSKGVAGVRFSKVIQPDRTRSEVSGSLGPAPPGAVAALRRL